MQVLLAYSFWLMPQDYMARVAKEFLSLIPIEGECSIVKLFAYFQEFCNHNENEITMVYIKPELMYSV